MRLLHRHFVGGWQFSNTRNARNVERGNTDADYPYLPGDHGANSDTWLQRSLQSLQVVV